MHMQKPPPAAFLTFSQNVASAVAPRLLHPCAAVGDEDAEEQLDPILGMPLAKGVTSE